MFNQELAQPRTCSGSAQLKHLWKPKRWECWKVQKDHLRHEAALDPRDHVEFFLECHSWPVRGCGIGKVDPVPNLQIYSEDFYIQIYNLYANLYFSLLLVPIASAGPQHSWKFLMSSPQAEDAQLQHQDACTPTIVACTHPPAIKLWASWLPFDKLCG